MKKLRIVILIHKIATIASEVWYYKYTTFDRKPPSTKQTLQRIIVVKWQTTSQTVLISLSS